MNNLNNTPSSASFFYPPGGILIWILIVLELITFGAALIALGIQARHDPALFHQSRLLLNSWYGTINTVVLLTSGYFMAMSVHVLKQGNNKTASRYLLYAIAGGLLFMSIKTLEYTEKIHHGYTIGYNTFFQFYWLLTLFHLIHVMVGTGILTGLYFSVRKKITPETVENTETGASFWHMVDLIWLLLFPVLYLIF